MPTLLQINVTSNWGSTGKIVEQIGMLAQAEGWESYVAYGRYDNPSHLLTIKVGTMCDVYEHYAENVLFDNEGLASRKATRQLIEQVRKIKPDIVHIHNIHDHWINYPILFDYLNSSAIPVVWTFHDCWAFTGHCAYFDMIDCERWKIGCGHCPMVGLANTYLYDRSSRNWNRKKEIFSQCPNLTIVPVSQWLGNYIAESFLSSRPIHVIRNGIDLSVFSPQSCPLNENFTVLAVSSVWDKRKGLEDIIRLRSLLSDDFRIVVVGLTAKQMKSLPNGIEGIGRTQNVQELVRLYSEADVLINPTYADTFPTVNLEALACGTPVITYNTGGSPEAVDEHTGMVVPQGDVNALSEAILTMKKHPFSSVTCRERAEKLFDKENCFRKYIDLYDSLLRIE